MKENPTWFSSLSPKKIIETTIEYILCSFSPEKSWVKRKNKKGGQKIRSLKLLLTCNLVIFHFAPYVHLVCTVLCGEAKKKRYFPRFPLGFESSHAFLARGKEVFHQG